MAENTNIEWCDATFNGWIGCTRISPACDSCYAAVSTPARAMGIKWGFGEPRHRTSESTWKQPEKWERQHQAFQAEHGRRRRVFCSSLADVFDKEVPPEWRLDLLNLISRTPSLDWLLLTKRVGNVRAMLSEAQRLAWARSDFELAGWLGSWLLGSPPRNVWLGATVVNQDEADRDVGKLLCTPARVHFLSIEPMLGPVVLPEVFMRPLMLDGQPRQFPDDAGMVNWVIVGGESGPHARPMHPDWARRLRDQCAAAGVAFMFKQWGEWLPGENAMHEIGHEVAHHQDGKWGATSTKVSEKNYLVWTADGSEHRGAASSRPAGSAIKAWAERVGKAAAGRTLDGRIHNEFPEVSP